MEGISVIQANRKAKCASRKGLLRWLLIALVLFSATSLATAQSSFRFLVLGDTKDGTATLQAESSQIVSSSLLPKFILYTGDLCSITPPTVNCLDAWKAALNGGNTNQLFNLTFAMRGNHDAENPPTVWQSYFNFGSIASAVGGTNYSAEQLDLTYSFDYGNAHFLVVDCPGGDASTITDSAILNFIDSDLSAAEGRGLTHAFIAFHGPLYYVDGHNSSVNTALVDILNKHPIVSATFHGHEHVLAYVHINSGRISTITHEFEEFVSGGAGAGLYSCAKGRSDWCDSKFGFMTVDVNGTSFTANLYQEGSTTPIKTLTLSKSQPGVTVTVSPASANLQVGHTQQFTATVTNSTQGVTWTATSTIGTVSATGLFTATAAGSGTVTATSIQDTSVSDSAQVTVTAAPTTFSISGTISHGGGASVALSGSATTTTTANSNGNYSFSSLANGTYVVTPTLSGFVIKPASRTVTINGADQTGVNFTAHKPHK